jgi:hypothetical protein
MKVENLKYPFILWAIVAIFGDFFSLFLYFSRFKKQGICERSFFFQNIFRKMAKIRHQKNRCCQGSSMVRSLLLKIVGRLSDYKQISTSPKSYSSWLSDSRVVRGFCKSEEEEFLESDLPINPTADSSEIRFHVVVSASGKCLKSSRLPEVFDQMQKWSELGNN